MEEEKIELTKEQFEKLSAENKRFKNLKILIIILGIVLYASAYFFLRNWTEEPVKPISYTEKVYITDDKGNIIDTKSYTSTTTTSIGNINDPNSLE